MTILLLLAVAFAVSELVAGVRLVRHNRPASPPASHPDWGTGALPSAPYVLRH